MVLRTRHRTDHEPLRVTVYVRLCFDGVLPGHREHPAHGPRLYLVDAFLYRVRADAFCFFKVPFLLRVVLDPHFVECYNCLPLGGIVHRHQGACCKAFYQQLIGVVTLCDECKLLGICPGSPRHHGLITAVKIKCQRGCRYRTQPVIPVRGLFHTPFLCIPAVKRCLYHLCAGCCSGIFQRKVFPGIFQTDPVDTAVPYGCSGTGRGDVAAYRVPGRIIGDPVEKTVPAP